MPQKKKKKEEQIEFVPSKYQEGIFEFVRNGHGNAVIEAVPGSGKSTTAMKCLELINPEEKVLLTAFNTDIVEELKKRVKKSLPKENLVDCRTMHSLGYLILMSNYPGYIDRKPNDFKYSGYIYNNITSLSEGKYSELNFKDRLKYIDNVKKLVDFGRFYLCESEDDMAFIEKHYDIPVISNECSCSLKVMKWGKENFSTIDFTDMVWLPNVLDCKPYGRVYDWIICDECQDMMTAERMLLLRCTKMSTRMLFFGEKLQCIYSFMGSDYRSFDELRKLPNTISLPLSISYRCSKNVVKYANSFNESMEPKNDAPDGEIIFNAQIEDIQDGDMVLCRNNAPLLELYCELANSGKTAYIRGNDVGSNLVKIIKKTKEEKLNKSLKKKGVFSALYDSLIDRIDDVMKRHRITMEMAMEDRDVSQMYDTIKALDAISDDIETADELIEKVKSLFSDKKKKGISLSTIHKAKGLESENVFICCPSLMPSKTAKEAWEFEQEKNLEYVAYTRAKTKLAFMDESKFKSVSSNAQQKISEITIIKDKIFTLYGDSERCKLSAPTHEAARQIIARATDITKPHKNIIDLSNNTKQRHMTSQIILPIRRKRKK
jgi:superfamily I DNA/RNA helicase